MVQAVPKVHSVHFYETHDALIDRLCGVIGSGLLVGNAVLIIATNDHRSQLIQSLGRLEIDVRNPATEGRFSICDADEILATFMVDDVPEPRRFLRSLRQLLMELKHSASSNGQTLTVFGEMVSVLWERGNKKGALALEELWNQVLNEAAFHLHCAYPSWLFSRDEPGMHNICESHSHVLGVLAPAA